MCCMKKALEEGDNGNTVVDFLVLERSSEKQEQGVADSSKVGTKCSC